MEAKSRVTTRRTSTRLRGAGPEPEGEAQRRTSTRLRRASTIRRSSFDLKDVGGGYSDDGDGDDNDADHVEASGSGASSQERAASASDDDEKKDAGVSNVGKHFLVAHCCAVQRGRQSRREKRVTVAASKNYREAAEHDDFGFAPGKVKRVKKVVAKKESSEESFYDAEDEREVGRGGALLQ